MFAHRGGAKLRPENTFDAFEHGLSLGADGLEFDVHLSRDGEVVVIHDATLDRTTNGAGHVRDHTASELSLLDAGFRFAEDHGYPFRARDVRIPLLREVLDRYRGVPIIIELKGRDPELARAAVAVAAEADAFGHVCFGGFNIDTLRAAREAGAPVTGAATDEIRQALTLSRIGLPPVRPSYRAVQVPEHSGATQVVTSRFVRALHRGGLPVYVWTVDAPDDMHRLLGFGVDGIISDRPDVAVDVVRRWRRA